MITLYCTVNRDLNGFEVIFGRPVAIKKLRFWGATRVVLYDYATIGDTQTALAAGTAKIIAEFRGTVSAPNDGIDCTNNEIIQCSRGVVIFADGGGVPSDSALRIYTMGNPVGSQGSV